MTNIYRNSMAQQKNMVTRQLVIGANIAGFLKVADAMIAHGIV